jgi:hypothetical protein
MTEDRKPFEQPLDPLDVFLREAAPQDPPADLVARILAATADAGTRQDLYWSDVGRAARATLFASAAALLLSAGLVGMVLSDQVEAARPAPTAALDDLDLSSDSLQRQMANGFMLLGEDR